MNIIIVGCGKIGTTMIESLAFEGHNIVAIDNNPEVISEIPNLYDVMAVGGNGADCETLAEAGVENADLFAAVTSSDELNMLSCYIAKSMGAKQTIARIRNPEYNDESLGFMKDKLGISLAINPELLTARDLYNILKLPSAARVETFSRRNVEMIELKLKEDSVFDSMSLIELRKKYNLSFLISAVQRDDEVYIPDGNFILKKGDNIGIIASPADLHKLLKSSGMLKKKARNIMILGASRTAYYLSKMLISGGNNVKIVEKNAEKAKIFADALPDAVIINGDGANQEVLLEEGLKSVDAFVALTGLDEENILLSCFANSHDVPKVITKVNRDEFIKMANKLGLDTIVSPRVATTDVVVRYARALQNSIGNSVETLYKLMDSKVEAMEFKVDKNCSIIDIPIKDLNIKKNTLICAVIRGRKAIIPSGNDKIEADDNVLIVTSGHRINNLSDIIK